MNLTREEQIELVKLQRVLSMNLTREEQVALAIFQGILSRSDNSPSHNDVEQRLELTEIYTKKFMRKFS